MMRFIKFAIKAPNLVKPAFQFRTSLPLSLRIAWDAG